ncbi:MAG: hypothetical protein LBU32_08475 [Clostridiales bacterium]|jgi:hypothetical protein|nr:hypothetical protein [Clostridiales bacterium]
MVHSDLESAKYYRSLAPALNGIFNGLTGDGFNSPALDLNRAEKSVCDTDMEESDYEKA